MSFSDTTWEESQPSVRSKSATDLQELKEAPVKGESREPLDDVVMATPSLTVADGNATSNGNST